MIPIEQFEAAVCEYYQPLFRFAMSLTRAESDASDLTQQTFYVLATKGHQLRDASRLKSWLFTTLHRAFLEIRRKQSRFDSRELQDVGEELLATPPERFEQADSAQVLSALARVDAVHQAAVALFYLEDYSYKDIAEILEVPIGTVKSRIARGIAQLRRLLMDGELAVPSREPNSSSRPVRPPAEPAEEHQNEWNWSSTWLGEQFRIA